VVGDLHAAPCRPLGLGIQISEVGYSHLEPDDKILFYSDGVTEARPSGGDEFGYQRLTERFERHLSNQLLAAETLRRITSEVMSHRAGPLRDDASLMLLEWQPASVPDDRHAG
jgi:serine phosphatase RsbU (regulator of sigma subunit)